MNGDPSSAQPSPGGIESPELLRLALHAAHGGAWEWDMVQNKLRWSVEMHDLIGTDPGVEPDLDDFLQKRIVAADRDRVWSRLREMAPSGESDWDDEFRIVHPARGERWIRAAGKIEFDAQGRPVRMIGLCRDITPRRAAERAARQRDEDFRAMADVVPVFVFTTNAEGGVEFVNTRLLDYVGLTAADVRGFGWTVVIHPDDLDRVLREWMHAVRTGEPYDTECRFRGSNGNYRWFAARSRAVLDESGGIARWFGCAMDIDDHKRTEMELQATRDLFEQRVCERTAELSAANDSLAARTAQLEESEARFKAFMDNTPAVAFIKDEEGRLVWVNRRWEEVHHGTLADAIGTTIDKWMPADVAGRLKLTDPRVLGGDTVQTTELFPGADGAMHSWLSVKFPLRDRSSRTLIGGVALDVTELRR
jgi:PAS domain S-box-containing protein